MAASRRHPRRSAAAARRSPACRRHSRAQRSPGYRCRCRGRPWHPRCRNRARLVTLPMAARDSWLSDSKPTNMPKQPDSPAAFINSRSAAKSIGEWDSHLKSIPFMPWKTAPGHTCGRPRDCHPRKTGTNCFFLSCSSSARTSVHRTFAVLAAVKGRDRAEFAVKGTAAGGLDGIGQQIALALEDLATGHRNIGPCPLESGCGTAAAGCRG